MERAVRVLIAMLCVALAGVFVVALLDSGEEEPRKAALIERLAADLRQQDVPPKLKRCLVRDLEQRLTEEAIRKARGKTIPALRQSGLLCARRLDASGAYTPRQLMRFGRRLRSLGF